MGAAGELRPGHLPASAVEQPAWPLVRKHPLVSAVHECGARRRTPPLKELGVDPVSEKPILLKDGQWGPYVTDGSTNASLQLGDSVEEITDERAVELLAERRAKV